MLPDGSVWVARVYQNRVDWIGPDGKTTRGAQLPDRILEVTRTDRELFVRRFPAELRTTVEQLPFAPVKPPFETAFAGPGGTVWLEIRGGRTIRPARTTSSAGTAGRSA